jgi:oligosaccharide repeat unit polymerase
MMIFDFKYILLIVTQTIISLFIRYYEKTWYSPSSLFALIWNFVIVFSLLSAPDYFFSVQGILLIQLFIIAFFAGGQLLNYSLFPKIIQAESVAPVSQINKQDEKVMLLGIVSGIIAFLLLLKDSGLSMLDALSIENIKAASFDMTVNRYNGVRLSSSIMLFLTISYLAAFVAGKVLAGNPDKRLKLIIASLLLPIVFFTIVYTARSVLIFMLVIIAGSYFAHKPLFVRGKPVLLSKVNLLLGLLVVASLFIVFIISQASRMDVSLTRGNHLAFLANYLKVWFSGNISGFCAWLTMPNDTIYANGFISLAGLSEWFGILHRKVGIYEIAIDVNKKMEFSNIYTFFRYIIDDLGITGSLIFFLIMGFLSHKFFNQSIKGKLTSAALLSGIFALLLFSFITSIFAYNSILFAWIGFVVWSYFNELKMAEK